MKLKNFFNSQRKKEVVQELKNDFMPILEKVIVPVTTYAKRNPKKTFSLMITIVIANILILFFLQMLLQQKKPLTEQVFRNLPLSEKMEQFPISKSHLKI